MFLFTDLSQEPETAFGAEGKKINKYLFYRCKNETVQSNDLYKIINH